MAGGVECPKGWGHVTFNGLEKCPISATIYCKDCKIATEHERFDDSAKRLKKTEKK